MRKGKEHKYFKEFDLKDAYVSRFVWEGESIDNWTEALEICNTWRKNLPPTPEGAYHLVMDIRKRMCPESTFSVINREASSMLYEIKTINCPAHPDEYSITRVLYGKSNVFSLIYTNKTKDLPRESREEWINILSGAIIKTGGREADYKPLR